MNHSSPTTSPEVLDLPLPAREGSQSQQVHAGLRDAILGGRLVSGTRLPSSRALAAQLGVRRNAVVVAFEQLVSDGLVLGRQGAGTFVAPRLPPQLTRNRTGDSGGVAAYVPPSTAPFALGCTHADPALLRRFGRLLRNGLADGRGQAFGYGDARGGERLRRAIADHLAAARGVMCDPRQIMITSGTQQALRLCAEALLRPGDAVWMEDPGYHAARRTFTAVGLRLVPVPVDGAGLDVRAGRRVAPGAAMAYITPSHQFPTGVTMTMERRVALLDWAHEAGAWLLEDDYDSEFRYDGPPLTALAGIDGQARVIYLGTFSKTLFAGLRVGYAVLPPPLVERIMAAREVSDRFPASLCEDALAALIEGGEFASHIRRMRTRYRAARDLLSASLLRASDGLLRVAVPGQGLHLVALLPPEWPPGAAAAVRAAAGIEARLLSEARIEPAPQDGFVLGFSGHDPAALRRAADRLGQAVRAYAVHPEALSPRDAGRAALVADRP